MLAFQPSRLCGSQLMQGPRQPHGNQDFGSGEVLFIQSVDYRCATSCDPIC